MLASMSYTKFKERKCTHGEIERTFNELYVGQKRFHIIFHNRQKAAHYLKERATVWGQEVRFLNKAFSIFIKTNGLTKYY